MKLFLSGYLGDGGPATAAALSMPHAVVVDLEGHLYVADSGHNRVRRVDAKTGVITTIAGTGTSGFSGDGDLATKAQTGRPQDLALDSAGNLYIAETVVDPDFVVKSSRVRKVNLKTGLISTVAGSVKEGSSGDGGPATSAALERPSGMALDVSGNIYVAEDDASHRIRMIDGKTGIITTIAGTGNKGFSGDGGDPATAQLNSPRGLVVDSSGNLYFADSSNKRIRKITFK